MATDRDLYVKQCIKVNDLIFHSKMTFYGDLIDSLGPDQRNLFSTVDKMIHKKAEKLYPSSGVSGNLANDFANFFCTKVTNIRSTLLSETSMNFDYDKTYPIQAELSTFTPVTSENLGKLIDKMSSKSCQLDPIPASVFKKCGHLLLPVITDIVNLSLHHALVPPSLKMALLLPSMKKPSLDHEEFSSFRPISNLKFLSKAVEKVVASQVDTYIRDNNLYEVYQSAYKKYHSTETASVKVQNDILLALDNRSSVILLLLDLSAAFDTVDHQILLSRLEKRFGFKGKVLEWFSSYLSDRTQFVKVEGQTSNCYDLKYGVPQGSVLGPMLFVLYTSSLADIIRQHGIDFHLYADDTQLYIVFKSSVDGQLDLAKSKIEACVPDIDEWMTSNMLKMNRDKTELLVLSARHLPQPPIFSVSVCSEVVTPSNYVRNIGMLLDCGMSMEQHITEVCKSGFYHLRNIRRIRKYLSKSAATTLVHAFITSRLDYGNSSYYGLPKRLIQKLQSVQNSAARLVNLSKRYDHISPILRELHWLPVEQRINFKIILLTFKCLHDMAPLYLKELVKPYEPKRTLRSSSKNLVDTTNFNLRTYGFRAFSVSAPTLWNALPDRIRNCNNIGIFKKLLKTHLFSIVFN